MKSIIAQFNHFYSWWAQCPKSNTPRHLMVQWPLTNFFACYYSPSVVSGIFSPCFQRKKKYHTPKVLNKKIVILNSNATGISDFLTTKKPICCALWFSVSTSIKSLKLLLATAKLYLPLAWMLCWLLLNSKLPKHKTVQAPLERTFVSLWIVYNNTCWVPQILINLLLLAPMLNTILRKICFKKWVSIAASQEY